MGGGGHFLIKTLHIANFIEAAFDRETMSKGANVSVPQKIQYMYFRSVEGRLKLHPF